MMVLANIYELMVQAQYLNTLLDARWVTGGAVIEQGLCWVLFTSN